MGRRRDGNFGLISVLKICLRAWGGGGAQKRPKMCLSNLWIVSWHFSNHVQRVGSHAQTNENRLTPQKQMQPNGNHALAKGGLISESFSLLYKFPKKIAKSLSWALSTYREVAQYSDLASFWGDLSQSEKIIEIKPPLCYPPLCKNVRRMGTLLKFKASSLLIKGQFVEEKNCF